MLLHTRMKVATWNVNSIRARRQHVIDWLDAVQPDVLCLQELKVTDADFPYDEIRECGYEAAVFGQKTYNGVAIVSRYPVSNVVQGLSDGEDDPQARLISWRDRWCDDLERILPERGRGRLRQVRVQASLDGAGSARHSQSDSIRNATRSRSVATSTLRRGTMTWGGLPNGVRLCSRAMR